MIQFSCSCGQHLKVKDELAGRKIKCPKCAEILRVPEAADRGEEERTVPSSAPINSAKRRAAEEEDSGEEERGPRRRRAETDDEGDEHPGNEAAIADLRRRISRANKWRYFFIFLMPLGFVVPCLIGLVLGRSNPKPEGFTLAQAFGIAALALPVVAFGGWLLLAGDRRKYLESLAVAKEADSLGFHFSEKAPKRLMKQLRSFRMFEDADDHFGLNCASGKKMGRTFSLLEYRTAYRTGVNPYDTKLNIQTVVVVIGLDKNLPDFRIGPKTWLSRLLKVFGARTIEIPGQTKFNRKFIVCGDDENNVEPAVNPDVVQLMLDADGTLEVRDDALLFYRHNHLEEPENYRDMIGLAGRIAKAICR